MSGTIIDINNNGTLSIDELDEWFGRTYPIKGFDTDLTKPIWVRESKELYSTTNNILYKCGNRVKCVVFG